MEKVNIEPLIQKEIKVACPNIRFQEMADSLEISYNQLFVKFRNGRFMDLNAPEESLNQ